MEQETSLPSFLLVKNRTIDRPKNTVLGLCYQSGEHLTSDSSSDSSSNSSDEAKSIKQETQGQKSISKKKKNCNYIGQQKN
jgi:hypothetical protein